MFIERDKLDKLKVFCNKLAWHYFSPVYLVGSSLKTEKYNDVDIIVLMKDVDFERKYGKIDEWIKQNTIYTNDVKIRNIWANDCYKQWSNGCDFTTLNLDLKIMPERTCVIKQPYLRLDKYE